MTAWIEQADVEGWLGRPLTPAEEAAFDQQLQSVQDRICAAIGWTPYPPSQMTFWLRGTWQHRLALPRWPVVQIESVLVSSQGEESLAPDGWWLAPPNELCGHWAGVWGGSDGTVEVDGTFGYVTLPTDLKALTTELTALVVTTDLTTLTGGIKQEVLGPYRVSYESLWSQAGQPWGGTDAIVARYRGLTNYSLAVTS